MDRAEDEQAVKPGARCSPPASTSTDATKQTRTEASIVQGQLAPAPVTLLPRIPSCFTYGPPPLYHQLFVTAAPPQPDAGRSSTKGRRFLPASSHALVPLLPKPSSLHQRQGHGRPAHTEQERSPPVLTRRAGGDAHRSTPKDDGEGVRAGSDGECDEDGGVAVRKDNEMRTLVKEAMQLWRLCDVAGFHAHITAHAEVHARSSLLFKICDDATGSSRLEQKTAMANALVSDIVKDEAVNYWDEPLNCSVREQPLHRAAYHKKAWLLRLLVRHDAINPVVNELNELPIDKGLMKLRRAVPAKDIIDCLRIVAERFPGSLGSGPGARPAPIHWLLETKIPFEIYAALVRTTAKHDARILKQRDRDGRDALLLLMEEDELTAKQPEILDVLLECGADLYTRNTVKGGENALHVAVRRINIQMVTRLLAHDAQRSPALADRLIDMKAKIIAPKTQKGAKRRSAGAAGVLCNGGRDKPYEKERYLTPLDLARSLHNPPRDMSITRIITQLKNGKENNKPHRVRGLVYSNRVPPFNKQSPLQVQVQQGGAHAQQQGGTRTIPLHLDPSSATTLHLPLGAAPASSLPSPPTPQPQDEAKYHTFDADTVAADSSSRALGVMTPAEPIQNDVNVEIDVLPGQEGEGGTSAGGGTRPAGMSEQAEEEEESDWDVHEEGSHGPQAGNFSGAGDDELTSKEASMSSDKQKLHGHQELCSFVCERQEEGEEVKEAPQQKRPRFESAPSSFLSAGVMRQVHEVTAEETNIQSRDGQEAMVHTLECASGAEQLEARFEAVMGLRSEALALLRHDTSSVPTMMERIRRLLEALQQFKSAAALAMRSADELSALRVIQAEFTQRVAGAQTAPTTGELEEATKAMDALKSKHQLVESIQRAWADDDVGIVLSVDLQVKLQRLEEVIRNEGAYKARLRGLCGRLVSVCTAASICKAMDFVSVLGGTV